jgi:phosphatidylserine/phosphatidylglycerophosphate/cardiolipin synthase-like enzyme
MLRLRVINNGDHAGLVWFPDDGQPIPNCRGFAIQRHLTRGAAPPVTSYLPNHVGFSVGAAAPPPGSEWEWPIQRYQWWDYDVQLNDVVSYQIVPVVGPSASALQLGTSAATSWSDPETITGQDGVAISAYFNRGIIASQWVAKALAAEAASQATPHAELMTAISQTGNALRNQLGGDLKAKLLALLQTAVSGAGKVYAALYELNDPEIIAQLKALGPRCFLILGNGAFKPPATDEASNAATRGDLTRNSTVNLSNRMVPDGHFAHNKFFVFCDASGAPQSVWTGSTNTTMTGLCTQANNGILVNNSAVAGAYLDAWNRLKSAGDGYPAALIEGNSIARSFAVPRANGEDDHVSVWFASTSAGQDMVQARQLIDGAQQGVLFLFFEPGGPSPIPAKQTLLQTITDRLSAGDPNYKAGLYVRGVVNQTIAGLTGPAAKAAGPAPADGAVPDQPVSLYTSGDQPPANLAKSVLVPAYVEKKFGDWEAELKGASNVMIHSKVVIVDPFGDHPVVMTGSHNMGMKASSQNDDNLIIVEGNSQLAQAYALNIIAIFQEYRWRQYVTAQAGTSGASVWEGLQDTDSWQAGYLKEDAAELAFWLG